MVLGMKGQGRRANNTTQFKTIIALHSHSLDDDTDKTNTAWVRRTLCVLLVLLCVCCVDRFMMVLVCLIFSVLSTIDHYTDFANQTLFWMVIAQYSDISSSVFMSFSHSAALLTT